MMIGHFDTLLPIRVAKSLEELEALSEEKRAVVRHAINDHVGQRLTRRHGIFEECSEAKEY